MLLIKKDLQSGKLLSKAMSELDASLNRPFEPLPDDPRTSYFNSALTVVFLAQCVLIELLKQEDNDLSGSGAVMLAISVADHPSAAKLIRAEIQDMLDEDPENLAAFLAGIRKMMEERKLGSEWLALLDIR